MKNKNRGQVPNQELVKTSIFDGSGIISLRNKKGRAQSRTERSSGAGQIMLLTVLILGGVIVGAASLVSSLIIYKIRQATDVGGSAKAVFASDSGIEWELFCGLKRGKPCGSASCPDFKNGARFESRPGILQDKALYVISIGEFANAVRINHRINSVGPNIATSSYPAHPDYVSTVCGG